jgi:hypothetical protein
MGASQSSAYNSGPVVQARGKGGLFQLTPDQQIQNDVLSNLFEILLAGNSLMNLADIVSEHKCDNLITILSTQISKEYQTLRFPEYLDPTKLGMVSYIGQHQFDKLKEDTVQKRVCDDIAEFLVRFVILVAALAVSVDMPPAGVAPSLRTKSVQSTGQKEPVMLESPLDYIAPQPEILNALLRSDATKHAVLETTDKPNVFSIKDSRYFLTRSGVVYSDAEMTNVVGIRFKYFRYYKAPSYESPFDSEVTDETQFLKDRAAAKDQESRRQQNLNVSRQQYAPRRYNSPMAAPFPAVPTTAAVVPGAAVPGAAAVATPVATPVVVGGKSQKSRKSRGVARKRVGTRKLRRALRGGDWESNFTSRWDEVHEQFNTKPKFYLVEFVDFYRRQLDGSADSRLIQSVVIDDEGNAWDLGYFVKSRERVKDSQNDSQPTLVDYIDRVFNKVKDEDEKYKVSTQELKVSGTSAKRNSGEEFQVNESTQKLLQELSAKISGQDGTVLAPAAYRAYLLASGTSLEEKGLLTSFCKDEWARKKLSDVYAYQFLEALFVDKPGMATTTNAEKNAFLKLMIGKGVVDGAADEVSFSRVSFNRIDTKDAISAFCGRSSQSTTNAQMIEMLMQAHSALRKLYDAHTANVFEFLKSVLVVDQDFVNGVRYAAAKDGYFAQPLIRLNPIFVTNPAGSRVALSQKIAEARKLLMEHYFRVETLYYTTVDMFARASLGEEVTAPIA